MTTNEALRFVTIASSAMGIFVMALVAVRFRERWLYTVPALIYLASAFSLGVVGLFLPDPVPMSTAVILNTASYIVRLESIFTLIAAGVIFLKWRQK